MGKRRFIPTRVGNTGFKNPGATVGTVHPHSRGEHHTTQMHTSTATGSSPLAWGTLSSLDMVFDYVRFIPTRVGNTSVRQQIQTNAPVHPHSRGEHCQIEQKVFDTNGSSPLAWGTPLLLKCLALLTRFIPTRVENTLHCFFFNKNNAVHPHSRGEHCYQ